jgi:tRNA nucleotidyltransferase (CCA-adding enzyme)
LSNGPPSKAMPGSGVVEVITTHVNADFDAMASMLAAKKLYPDAKMTFSGSQEKGLRDFFVRSTFYAFDFVRIKDVDFDAIDRLILVDIRQIDRIGPFRRLLDKPNIDVHIYDHHPGSDKDITGSHQVIRPTGATTTIFAEIIQERSIPLTPDEATIMMLGIYEDTGSLTFTSTTPEDLLAAAFLLKSGANLNIVSDMLTQELTADQVEMLGELLRNRETHTINGVDVTIIAISKESYVGDLAVLVHKIKDMENLNALFVLALLGDRTYLVARSRIEEVDAGEIALAFGGGGHSTAASASIAGLTIVEAKEKLIRVLHEKVNPVRTAAEIMSFPVKSVPPGMSLRNAAEMLSRYNVNVLAIVEGDNRLLGTISRQTIERGLFHGIGELPVRELMNAEVATVTPQTPLRDIQALIIDRNQRFLPVVLDSRLMGAITRTDLLRALYYGASPRGHSPDDELEAGSIMRTKSVIKLMEERLTPRIMDILKELGNAADDLGFNAYAVGGFVRDLWLRRDNFDIDVVIEGDGIAFARHLEKAIGAHVRPHEKFGTAVLVYPDGFKVDIATARTEYYEYPGALPVVEGSTLKLDLYRRDFTINTLAVKLNPRGFGTLIDFFGAIRDLKERVIRVIQNLSFVEDPTRIFRAVRFEKRFDFSIGKQTEKLIKNAVKLNVFDRLAGARLLSELDLIFDEEDPYAIIERLASFDLLRFIHPNLKATEQMETRFSKMREVSSWYDLLFLTETYDKGRLFLFALIWDLAPDERKELLTRLMISQQEQKKMVGQLDRVASASRKLSVARELPPSEIYQILNPLVLETLLFMMAISTRDANRRYISLFITRLKATRVETTGDDLRSLGIDPGEIFSTILNDLLMQRLDSTVIDRESELSYVRKTYLKQRESVARVISP